MAKIDDLNSKSDDQLNEQLGELKREQFNLRFQAATNQLERPARIREELNQRGLQRAEVEQAIRECGFNWQEKMHETWQRKFAGQLPADARERAKQGRFLSYRGYPMDMIGRLLSGRGEDD